MRQKIKSHLLFNARQRRGVLFFLLIIIAIQMAYFLADFTIAKDELTIKNEAMLQQKIDSLKAQIPAKKTEYQLSPFNPNFITDFKGYQLGMSTQEIDRLLAFRKSGKFVNSAEEFQQLTKISDSLLQKISPLFKFPDWVSKSKTAESVKNKNQESSVQNTIIKLDINKASEEDFIKINGIGPVLAKRIVDYRTKIGGFSIDDQLYEVWNLDPAIVAKVLAQFTVIEKPLLKKININTATFKEVLSIVYIDYELCKKIFNYKREIAEYQNLEQLKKIDGFPLDKFERIILYLEAK